MQIVATKLTAALTGVWTILGMGAYLTLADHWNLDSVSYTVGFFATGTVFFFLPCLLFVAGLQWLKFGVRDIPTARYWRAFGQACIRGLCWFVGAGLFSVVYMPLIQRLYAN